jgi:hypothetical protein
MKFRPALSMSPRRAVEQADGLVAAAMKRLERVEEKCEAVFRPQPALNF